MSIQIGERKIGDGEPCFITLEAGPTHDGLETAVKLIQASAESGADAVKFQMLDANKLVADKQQLFSYDVLLDRDTGATETVSEPLYDILSRRQLKPEEWREVKQEADRAGIAFFATVGFEDEVEFLAELGCDSIKIASADLNHYPLLELAAKSGMLVQLDTGNGTLGEVEAAVDVLEQKGCNRILIHQCPSGYPAHLDSIHLNMIKTLKQMFPYPAAFSDHTPGWEIDIAAVAIGADLLEKTISLDRTTRSVEHIFSVEPATAADFVNSIRDVETAIGSHRRYMTPEQKQNRMAVRRSAFVNKPIQTGEILKAADIEFRRPGFGIDPTHLESLVGRKVLNDLDPARPLKWSEIEDQ